MIANIKGIRWALVFRAFIWTAIWCAAFALVFMMSQSLAEDQPVIFGIIMVAAVIGSVALAHARINWYHGAWGSALAALAVGTVAIVVHSALEASFWSGIIDQINEQVIREKALYEARDVVAEKRKQRYATSSVGKGASQIEAELKAAEMNDRWRLSAGCSDATTKPSQDFCRSYFEMKAQLAAAKEAGQLESVVWSAGTTVDTQVRRNLAAAAKLGSRWFGGEVEDWTGRIVAALVILIQLALAFAFVIGYAPDKRSKKRMQALKLVPAPDTTAEQIAKLQATVTAMQAAERKDRQSPYEKISGVPAILPATPTPPEDKEPVVGNAPDVDVITPPIPPDPADRAPVPTITETATVDDTVIDGPWDRPPVVTKRDKLLAKRERTQSLHTDVITRFADTMEPDPAWELHAGGSHKAGGLSAEELYRAYRRWATADTECKAMGYDPIGKGHYGRYIGVHFDRGRNSGNATYNCRQKIHQTKRRAA